MMRVSCSIREQEGSAGIKTRAAAIMVAGLALLPRCQAELPPPSSPVEVKQYLAEVPANLAERLNEPGTGSPLKGRLADCRGAKACEVPLYPGHILLNVKFAPENEGNLEVTTQQISGTGVVFQKRTDFNFSDPAYELQEVPFGETRQLFNTDLRVRVERKKDGAYAIVE
ncbi:MAG: hypothetical protein AB1529_06495 [Candidatus Micrarchaeota archaeon]